MLAACGKPSAVPSEVALAQRVGGEAGSELQAYSLDPADQRFALGSILKMWNVLVYVVLFLALSSVSISVGS